MKGKRILLVEDDPYLRRACDISLRHQGHTVILALDGLEALQKIRDEKVDLVLLDLLMPKLSGIEVLTAIKADEETRAIPVVILSNSSAELQVDKAKTLGALDYLVKANLSLKQLTMYVNNVLASLYPE
jgi:CheY-like chemotaxis protein